MLHRTASALLLASLLAAGVPAAGAPPPLLVASILDLDGGQREIGRNMRRGINVGLRAMVSVRGEPVRVIYRSDSHQWQRTIEALRDVVKAEPVALLGNTGSVTTVAALPVLEALELPLVAPYSGASFLREPGLPVVNLRPSHQDEAKAAVHALVAGGVPASSVCAIVGEMTIADGVIAGLAESVGLLAPDSATADALAAVNRQVFETDGVADDTQAAPVAVLDEARLEFASALTALASWEEVSGADCEALVFTGDHRQAVRLADYLRYRNDDAVLVLLSRAHSSQLSADLRLVQADRRVLLAQVMPFDDEGPQVLREAREDLGAEFDRVTLEGYLAGRLFRLMVSRLGYAPVTTETLLGTVLGQRVNLGGLTLDFRDDNQGLDDVTFVELTDAGWQPLSARTWARWRQ